MRVLGRRRWACRTRSLPVERVPGSCACRWLPVRRKAWCAASASRRGRSLQTSVAAIGMIQFVEKNASRLRGESACCCVLAAKAFACNISIQPPRCVMSMGTGVLAGSALVPEEPCCCSASMSVRADIVCCPLADAAINRQTKTVKTNLMLLKSLYPAPVVYRCSGGRRAASRLRRTPPAPCEVRRARGERGLRRSQRRADGVLRIP